MSITRLGLNICTTLSHLSTPFIATFVLIHLSAPVSAILGGSGLSSQVMLFGREYYQGYFTEPWLVFAPLCLHVFSGVSKRILSIITTTRDSTSTPGRANGPRTNILSVTAYSLVIFLSIHVLTHRLIPSTAAPPIQALSPSELDYDFVKLGIKTWPFRSAILYGGLLISAVLHSLEGINAILRTWFPTTKRLSATAKRFITDTLVSSTILGLARIYREAAPVLLKATSERVSATYLSFWIYRL